MAAANIATEFGYFFMLCSNGRERERGRERETEKEEERKRERERERERNGLVIAREG